MQKKSGPSLLTKCSFQVLDTINGMGLTSNPKIDFKKETITLDQMLTVSLIYLNRLSVQSLVLASIVYN